MENTKRLLIDLDASILKEVSRVAVELDMSRKKLIELIVSEIVQSGRLKDWMKFSVETEDILK